MSEKAKNKYNKLLWNTMILGLGVFGSKILVFLMMPLYTGILSPEEYSLADLIAQTSNLLIPLACVGISDGVFRFSMDREANRPAVLASGISANLSCGGVYFGDPADFSPDACHDCAVQRDLTEQFHKADGGRILVDASIHGEYTSSAPLWRWMAEYARTHGLRMHMHVSETRAEHEASLRRHHMTPFHTLAQYGVWDNGGIAAHCVYTTPEDWALMAEKGVSCVHNPWSNLKLGSGVAPIPAMAAAGVNIALGTDGMSSHNSADLFADMKLAAVLHNGVGCDPLAVTARQALRMATSAGADALGRHTGRILPGYAADLILVDLEAPNLVPCHDEAEDLVFSAHGSNVTLNMARGNVIYENGIFHTLDLEHIKAEVRGYALPLIF